MKGLVKIKKIGKHYIDSIIRYPFTSIMLILAAINNMLTISRSSEQLYEKLFITFILGASIFVVFQMLYERFCEREFYRFLFMGITAVLTVLYYLIIYDTEFTTELTVRTAVILFVLLIAFIWIPVIRSRVNFNESFMAAFKAFFVTMFFYGILFLGITVVLSATNLLIIHVNEKAYIHTANILFVLLAPIQFLSFIPRYPGRRFLVGLSVVPAVPEAEKFVDPEAGSSSLDYGNEQVKKEEFLLQAITPVRFLETLVSYIIIPVTAVFTVILLLYIVMNITGEFWTDNLMEPMLVTYSVAVIIVYLLSSTMKNFVVKLFRRIFPKLLVPVVVFQTISSVLKINDLGITYGRYYVIMFGIFATIAGVIFCLKPVQKNGLIAPVLIVLSLITVIPYIDAFTLSRMAQTNRLIQALERNHMLEENQILPNEMVSEADKQTIISSVEYLNRMDDTKNIPWLSKYATNYDFKATFGFEEYAQSPGDNRYISVVRNQNTPIPITGYDFMIHYYISDSGKGATLADYELNDRNYKLVMKEGSGQIINLLEDEAIINSFDMKQVYDKNLDKSDKTAADTITMTYTEDNSAATLTVVAENININVWNSGKEENAEIYILIKIK